MWSAICSISYFMHFERMDWSDQGIRDPPRGVYAERAKRRVSAVSISEPQKSPSSALKLKPIIAEKAKENEKVGAEMTNTGLQKSVKAVNTQKELAKTAGVSHDTIQGKKC